MANNPNPARITNALWSVWEACLSFIPGLRLGGIYGDKVCYHNTVNANKSKWPGAYCIQHALDLKGPFDKGRAIDLTMSTEQMKLRTGYLKRAALHPDDNRLDGLREFIGTIDGTHVYCLCKNSKGVWEYDGTRDTSHLWHIHISVYTFYVDNQSAMDAVISVLSGVTWEEWNSTKGEVMAKLVQVNDGPDGNGAVYGSSGSTYRGFSATPAAPGVPARSAWENAQEWAAFWKCPTTNLEVIPWARVPELLGRPVDLAEARGTDGSASGVAAHDHDISLTISTTGSATGKTGPAKPKS